MWQCLSLQPMTVVQIPLPRKGTETVVCCAYANVNVFKFHYPARGRKRVTQGCGGREHEGFKFHYPARGRKRPNSSSGSTFCRVVQIPLPRKGTETISSQQTSSDVEGSNSITPQGDGNHCDELPTDVSKAISVQIPLPRKGTETIPQP